MLVKWLRSSLWAMFLILSACPAVAAKAPDFTVFDQTGDATSLKDYAGKGLILHFWVLGVLIASCYNPI